MAYTWRGAWTSALSYLQGSVVSLRGAYFVSTALTTPGQSPPGAPWSILPDYDGSVPVPVPTSYTTAALLAQPTFYIAHRGSGGEFPEHNIVGYRAAAQAMTANGLIPAIEVSCVGTADKVVFCMHDQSLDDTTTGTGLSTTWTWPEIKGLVRSDEDNFLGPGWPHLELNTVHEVMREFADKTVIFLEAKDNQSLQPIQRMLLNDFPGSQRYVVWKLPATNLSGLTWGKTNGYTTWAYLSPTADDPTATAQMDAAESVADMWGVPVEWPDSRITMVNNRPIKKDMIAYQVHRRVDASRLTPLGVRGMMCSRILYVTRTTTLQYTMQARPSPQFARQIQGPGNMGRVTSLDTRNGWHLEYDPADQSAFFSNPDKRSSLMGENCIVPPLGTYVIRFSMMFPVVPTDVNANAGIAFGRVNDSPYLFGEDPAFGGYHIVLRADGRMQIYTHNPGASTGTQLATIATPAPVAGVYADYKVDVTPTTVTVTRTDVEPDITVSATNNAYRGAYFHLSTGGIGNASVSPTTGPANTPHWRGVSLTAT